MNEYIQISFGEITGDIRDSLIALLATVQYDGFEETETGLNAFISSEKFDEGIINELAKKFAAPFTKQIIPPTNWNKVWESNFDPVTVGSFCSIRAFFHEKNTGAEYDILITPKQSFGTGHHATTYMMVQQMKGINFKQKTVFDFGTGTGVLAILAEKLGAEKILATDCDDWSIENAAENFEVNECSKIELQKLDTVPIGKKFDIILANINKNVILENITTLINQLNANGTLLLSGLLIEDADEISKAVQPFNIRMVKRNEMDKWLCLYIST